jgi:cobalt/nickel transport system permease protein
VPEARVSVPFTAASVALLAALAALTLVLEGPLS